jgi:hypothetical protein
VKKSAPAADPDAYLAALTGWRQRYVAALRSEVMAAAPLREEIKWGNLVYFSNGPALMIRAEENRVLFGFWRGQRLRDIEPRLTPGGKYEMATLTLADGTPLERDTVAALVRQAVALNAALGDPASVAGSQGRMAR